jgi:hypothetical protein
MGNLAWECAVRMIEEAPGTDWRELQERVAAILRECGLVQGNPSCQALGHTETWTPWRPSGLM